MFKVISFLFNKIYNKNKINNTNTLSKDLKYQYINNIELLKNNINNGNINNDILYYYASEKYDIEFINILIENNIKINSKYGMLSILNLRNFFRHKNDDDFLQKILNMIDYKVINQIDELQHTIYFIIDLYNYNDKIIKSFYDNLPLTWLDNIINKIKKDINEDLLLLTEEKTNKLYLLNIVKERYEILYNIENTNKIRKIKKI